VNGTAAWSVAPGPAVRRASAIPIAFAVGLSLAAHGALLHWTPGAPNEPRKLAGDTSLEVTLAFAQAATQPTPPVPVPVEDVVTPTPTPIADPLPIAEAEIVPELEPATEPVQVASLTPPTAQQAPTPPTERAQDLVSQQSYTAAHIVNALHNPKPRYPRTAVRKRQEGVVMLTVKVTGDGSVADVTIAESSGHVLLDREARNTVLHWQFEPARYGGVTLQSEIQIPIRFDLADAR
jgi:protein TonB